jgi:hypothetical protein
MRSSQAMQVHTILHQLLSLSIHKTRLKGLVPVITALIKSKKLQLSQLGRSLSGKNKERSGIRLIDNLLSNPFYQNQAILFYRSICHRVVGNNMCPDIIVDWSSLPNSQLRTEGGEHCVLRAVLATTGRGVTLYEEVHPKKKENNAKVHEHFLNNLSSILPQGCIPCILTDAGFKNPWLKAVAAAEQLKLHYDFQANSYKHRRVLSFFYLGCQIIRKKIEIAVDWALIHHENKYHAQ